MLLSQVDQDGDDEMYLKDLPVVLALLGETKVSQEKLNTIYQALEVTGEDLQEKIALETFLDKIGPHLENYGSKDEFIEAFRVLDDDGKGSIPVNKFRYYMLEYGEVDPSKLDDMVMDIFGMKKNAPIDPEKPIDYKEFASKMFDPPKPKDKKKKKKGGRR